MYIRRLKIENFRSFNDFDAWLDPGTNIIVGHNNSGKTSVMKALDLALNPYVPWYRSEVLSRADYNLGRVEDPIRMELWIACDPSQTQSGCPECNRREPVEEGPGPCPFMDRICFWDKDAESFVREPTFRESDSMEKNDESASVSQIARLQFVAEWDEELETAEPTWSFLDENGDPLDDSSTYFKPERVWIGFHMLRSLGDPGKALNFSRSSLLADVTSGEEFRTIARRILSGEGWEDQFREVPSLDDLLDYYEEVGGNLVGGQSFGITSSEGNPSDLLRTLEICTHIPNSDQAQEAEFGTENSVGDSEDNGPLPLTLSRQGQGVQQLLALMTAKRLLSESGEQAIIAVEEPEAHLEPHLQRWVSGELLHGSTESHSQVIITTHSPEILRGCGNLDRVMILRDGERISRVRETDNDYIGRRLRTDLYAALFADRALIMEGQTEYGFYPELAMHWDAGENEEATSAAYTAIEGTRTEIVNGAGAQLSKTVSVLENLGIKTAVMMDGDDPNTIEKVRDVCSWVLQLNEGEDFEKVVARPISELNTEDQCDFFCTFLDEGGDQVQPDGKLHQVLLDQHDMSPFAMDEEEPFRPKSTPKKDFKGKFLSNDLALNAKSVEKFLDGHKSIIEGRLLAHSLSRVFHELPSPIKASLMFVRKFTEGNLEEGCYFPTEEGM